MTCYETGEEVPEILDSGSCYYSVFTTYDEQEAIQEFYKFKNRNYLWKVKNYRPIAY